MEDAPLRKSDLSFIWSGTMCRIVMIGGTSSILWGLFTDPAFQQSRPGIVDGVLGAGLAGVFAILLGGWLANGWERMFLAMRRDNLFLVRPHFDPAFAVGFFGSIALSALSGWFLSHVLGLRWPLCGAQPVILPGALGFMITFSLIYGRWYGRLPE